MGVPEQLADRMSMAEQHEYLRARFSRRTMIRGGAVTLGAVTGGAFVTGATAQAAVRTQPLSHTETVDGAYVAPFGRHLAYGNDPRTEITVSWQVPVAVKKPFIRIGTHASHLSVRIDAEIRTLYTPAGVGASGDHTQYYVHAALTRLKPGRTYFYGVGHDGFDPAAPQFAGTIGTFTTAPAHKAPFTFTAFGDQGVSYHALANDSLILGQNPSFHLHAGDIAYGDPAGQGKTSDTVFDSRTWDQFLAQTESVAKSVPWMVSFGNHDMEAWYSPNGYGGEEARWNLPDNGPDKKNLPGVYSFVYGNTAIISLDPNDVSFEIPANLGISGGTQTKWFESQLKKFRAAKDIDFVVVFFHHCAYCTSTAHASEGASARSGCRCSTSTRWTWSSTATTTSTSAPTSSRATPSPRSSRSAARRTPRPKVSSTSRRARPAAASTPSRPRTPTRGTRTRSTRWPPSSTSRAVSRTRPSPGRASAT